MRLWLPVMCTTMMLAACSSDDSNGDPKPEPTPEPEVKSIFYTATVGGDTRATVDGNNKTLKFAEGDRLYISTEDPDKLWGYLTLTSGAGTTDKATFSGTLYYTGDLPESNTSVTGTLVGEDNESLTTTGGKVTGSPNYGTGLVLPDGESTAVNEAVKKYGYLTGTSTFGYKTFNYLTQQTAFLNFTVYVKKSGVKVNDEYTVTVANVGGYNRTGTVKITESGSYKVLKFAVPIEPHAIPDASLTIPDNNAIPFGRATALVAKVYNVSREVDDYVDFGFESGVKWAKTNLGAATETNYGYFYAWGGTTGYSSSDASDHTFSLNNAPFYSGSAYTKYTLSDDLRTLLSADDAATKSRGTGWRIPTKADYDELIAGTDASPVTDAGGLLGYKFVKKGDNTKYIYLPAAGYRNNDTFLGRAPEFKSGDYWLSTLFIPSPPTDPHVNGAYCIDFNTTHTPQTLGLDRLNGLSIRPVYKP